MALTRRAARALHALPSAFAALAAAILAGCRVAPAPLVRDDSRLTLTSLAVRAPDPGQPGPFTVRHLYYGSGTDRRRAVYRDSVAMRTPSVNAAPFLRGIDRKVLKRRAKWWGFDERHFPLDGRVWYPEGLGPFPLVLIVHGNHDMKKFSDPGYAYLGELLASRGFITVSVDENFLNGELRTENDGRAWVLLQHLAQWRRWNADSASPFHGRVDMSRVALVGHSRGGEAVAIAAAFNRLQRYPDDANVAFDFGFGIRGVVALAPVDGQYRPSDKPTPLSDVSYLLLHGAHDADVKSPYGMRQYERVRFTHPGPAFKAALYIYRANHGQFNTVWGDNDIGDEGWILDRKVLLAGEEQRRIAKLYIGGFAETVLHDRREYLPMFRDYRAVGQWLPRTIYLSRYDEPRVRIAADYEEDVDVTTPSVPGYIHGEHLSTWREGGLFFRDVMRASQGTSQNNTVAMVGWRPAGADSARREPATYAISFVDSVGASWHLTSDASLVFALANAGSGTVAPGAPPRDTADLDFTVELATSDGHSARLPLSRYGVVHPPLVARVTKWRIFERRMVSRGYDDVLQRFAIPLGDFAAASPGFDPALVRTVRFVFDRSPSGNILLDDLGFSAPSAARTP